MKGAYYPCHVRPSSRTRQRGSHWTDLILVLFFFYKNLFRNSKFC
jgi:hypothetical protein